MNPKKVDYRITPSGCWECISHSPDSSGYPRAVIGGKRIKLSRYMYEHKDGPIPAGSVIRHKCDNPMCINPDHLEVGTQYQNVHDMINRGRRKPTHGSLNSHAKLTDADVTDILKLFKSGERQVDIARRYGIARHCVYSIVHKRTWKHLHEEGKIL
jgi:hypothetical protein